ncbi:MAG: 3'-5' exonuclease [Reichenbachiella sp.]
MIKNYKQLIFIDIETATSHPSLEDMEDSYRELWLKKASRLQGEEEIDDQEFYFERAGIYAEFGKVISISLGILHRNENDEMCLRVKGLKSVDEKELLTSFISLFSNYDQSKIQLCAHNGKEFDYPYLSRRMLINGIQLPFYLELSGKKPWEVQHLDTLQMWKFGDWKSYTSLELLTQVFNIPSPKGDIDGSDVNRVFYEEKDLDRISHYCNLDVVATAQVFMKMKGEELILEENMVIIE